MQHRREAVGERPHRRRWREHLHDVGHGPHLGSRPAAEGKREHAVGEHESRLAVCADDHGAIGQRLEVGSPGLAVAAAVDAAPALQGSQTPRTASYRGRQALDPVLDAVTVLTPQLIDEGRFGIEPGAPRGRPLVSVEVLAATICAAT